MKMDGGSCVIGNCGKNITFRLVVEKANPQIRDIQSLASPARKQDNQSWELMNKYKPLDPY